MPEAEITEAKRPPGVLTRMKRWTYGMTFLGLVCVAGIRYLPTFSHVGQVQRVYEKALEYRVEFVTSDGEVRVFNNIEQRFPYLKWDTADLQANLERFQREGDTVRIDVWGFRAAIWSAFPNVVGVERLEAGTTVRKARNARVVSAVLAELGAMQLVPVGREGEIQQRLQRAIEIATEPLPGGDLR